MRLHNGLLCRFFVSEKATVKDHVLFAPPPCSNCFFLLAFPIDGPPPEALLQAVLLLLVLRKFIGFHDFVTFSCSPPFPVLHHALSCLNFFLFDFIP